MDNNEIKKAIMKLADKQKVDKSWVELGHYLDKVQKEKMYVDWGYSNFTEYCSKEL